MPVSFQKILATITILVAFFTIWSGREGTPEIISATYPEHLTGAFTGGFGEQTCHSCHFDYDLNREEGSLIVDGVPGRVKAGKAYEIQIQVNRDDLGKAGFQMSARYPDGRQAGSFLISGNGRIMLTKQAPDSLQFIQHSKAGTQPSQDNHNIWMVVWEAPEFVSDSIYINIASNAANGDQSEFGDWIYTYQSVIKN